MTKHEETKPKRERATRTSSGAGGLDIALNLDSRQKRDGKDATFESQAGIYYPSREQRRPSVNVYPSRSRRKILSDFHRFAATSVALLSRESAARRITPAKRLLPRGILKCRGRPPRAASVPFERIEGAEGEGRGWTRLQETRVPLRVSHYGPAPHRRVKEAAHKYRGRVPILPRESSDRITIMAHPSPFSLSIIDPSVSFVIRKRVTIVGARQAERSENL